MKAPGIVQLNAGKHIKQAVPLLTFAKTKKKTCLAFRAAVLTRILLLCRNANVLRASFLLRQLLYNNNFNLLRYDATQRCEAVICVTCIVCML